MPTALSPETDTWLTKFAAGAQDPSAAAGGWLALARGAALARFRHAGFPTAHDEDWRFTNVEPIARASFLPPDPVADDSRVEESLARATSGISGGPRLVFLNGRFCAQHSSTTGLPRGARLESLGAALKTGGRLVEPHLGRTVDIERYSFAALNSALWEDGVLLHLAEGAEVTEPILFVFLSSHPAQPTMTSPRILVIADARARATIVESYGDLPGDPTSTPRSIERANGRPTPASSQRKSAQAPHGAYFTNTVAEIVLGEDAAIEHVKLQLESLQTFHVATIAARLSRGSRYDSRSVSVGGALVRNDLVTVLDGEGAECTLDGLFLASGAQHVDNHTTIDHARPHGTSRETYKGILTGRSRGVFDGKIIVRPDAQKTDSRQVNRNLLLSDSALINTKPQLEINADDVKCAHAATIGRLDEASLFYLRSRGLGHDEARALLIDAFASEVVGRIGLPPVRARLSAMVHALATYGDVDARKDAA